MKDLLEIRDEIDVLDKEIVELYKKRMALAEDVATYKIANNKNVYDKAREDQKLEKLSSYVDDGFLKQGVVELFEQIMSTSRKRQYKMLAEHGLIKDLQYKGYESFDYTGVKVVYQGVMGAYSQMATKAFFGDVVEASAVATWRDAMEAITAGKADYAVLPIENSTAGIVGENYDLLIDYDVSIIGEQTIKIDHALLGLKGATLNDIKTVYSHPQALMQCSNYLQNIHGDWEQKSMRNTAVSAQKIMDDNDKSQAAIAGAHNAEIYGLSILADAIQNESENSTRFIIVSNEKKYLKNANKVSLSFELPHEKGSLYHILSHFIFNGLNMTKIESRPLSNRNMPGKKWEYRFFIDFEGNLQQEEVINALRGLQEETAAMKILGNYIAG